MFLVELAHNKEIKNAQRKQNVFTYILGTSLQFWNVFFITDLEQIEKEFIVSSLLLKSLSVFFCFWSDFLKVIPIFDCANKSRKNAFTLRFCFNLIHNMPPLAWPGKPLQNEIRTM